MDWPPIETQRPRAGRYEALSLNPEFPCGFENTFHDGVRDLTEVIRSASDLHSRNRRTGLKCALNSGLFRQVSSRATRVGNAQERDYSFPMQYR